MRLGTRIFLANLIIFVLCFSYPVHWAWDNLRARYLESVEDPLNDQANILAALVGAQLEAGRFDPQEFGRVFERVDRYPVLARIYKLEKTGGDLEVYLTDERGMVSFDSADASRVGQDYSHWRDVRLTLQGVYGARTTKARPGDPSSSVLHVAAPVMVHGRIAGVLTVAKPTATINHMLLGFRPVFTQVFALSALIALAAMLLVSYWLALPIRRLTRYANRLRAGERVPLPPLNRSEIGEMGQAFERLREALEGKDYVKGYVNTLTHELKSPLSAIRAAAELLGEPMEPTQRERFLANIRGETSRIQEIVDRMLELSVLENRKELDRREKVSSSVLLRKVLESKHAVLTQKALQTTTSLPADLTLEGDAFLLQQALANLVQNAIDFSPPGGRLELSVEAAGAMLRFVVRDFGPGIPEYARTKVFDRFYSLQRPDTGKKSTGLGLNFVREVAVLHGGRIDLGNCPEGGLRAELVLPRLEQGE